MFIDKSEIMKGKLEYLETMTTDHDPTENYTTEVPVYKAVEPGYNVVTRTFLLAGMMASLLVS